MTKLIMHYAPGFLVVLQQDPCPGRHIGWGYGHKTDATGCCRGDYHTYKVVKWPHPLSTDETGWALQQCKIKT